MRASCARYGTRLLLGSALLRRVPTGRAKSNACDVTRLGTRGPAQCCDPPPRGQQQSALPHARWITPRSTRHPQSAHSISMTESVATTLRARLRGWCRVSGRRTPCTPLSLRRVAQFVRSNRRRFTRPKSSSAYPRPARLPHPPAPSTECCGRPFCSDLRPDRPEPIPVMGSTRCAARRAPMLRGVTPPRGCGISGCQRRICDATREGVVHGKQPGGDHELACGL
jgi:hypothetical protein